MQNLFVSLLALTASIGACTPASSETSMPGVDSQAPAIAANTAPLEQEKRLTLAEGGFSFALPSGWNYTLKEGTYTLSKAGEEVEITISAHTSASLQEIMDEGAAPISNPETDTYLNPALKTYGTDGVHLSMNGKAGGR
ncbi:MAG TPA: hypothetical protein PKD90_19090, partial [Phnomibacter sp.]|nr:hypothetical protein [Phnomibacter sp.]